MPAVNSATTLATIEARLGHARTLVDQIGTSTGSWASSIGHPRLARKLERDFTQAAEGFTQLGVTAAHEHALDAATGARALQQSARYVRKYGASQAARDIRSTLERVDVPADWTKGHGLSWPRSERYADALPAYATFFNTQLESLADALVRLRGAHATGVVESVQDAAARIRTTTAVSSFLTDMGADLAAPTTARLRQLTIEARKELDTVDTVVADTATLKPEYEPVGGLGSAIAANASDLLERRIGDLHRQGSEIRVAFPDGGDSYINIAGHKGADGRTRPSVDQILARVEQDRDEILTLRARLEHEADMLRSTTIDGMMTPEITQFDGAAVMRDARRLVELTSGMQQRIDDMRWLHTKTTSPR